VTGRWRYKFSDGFWVFFIRKVPKKKAWSENFENHEFVIKSLHKTCHTHTFPKVIYLTKIWPNIMFEWVPTITLCGSSRFDFPHVIELQMNMQRGCSFKKLHSMNKKIHKELVSLLRSKLSQTSCTTAVASKQTRSMENRFGPD
jgi:hypothetical protein